MYEYVYVHENACIPADQFIFEYLPEDFHKPWPNNSEPNRLTQKIGRNDPPTKAETTHPQNWPKQPRRKRLGPKRPRAETTRIHYHHTPRLRTSAVIYNLHACLHKGIPNVSYSLSAKRVPTGQK